MADFRARARPAGHAVGLSIQGFGSRIVIDPALVADIDLREPEHPDADEVGAK